MSSIKLFEVGGHIRDGIMNIESNDIDYCVEASSFGAMLQWVTNTHEKVFLVTPEKFTVRALFSKGDVRDYVLCRKEGPYSDGRRPDWVKVGTFEDDILRRDFSVNGLAREVGTEDIIDIVGGIEDIKNRRLRCIGSAYDRFSEDSLRIIRAIRFIVVKGFHPDREIEDILFIGDFAEKLSSVSVNRRREELMKCMRTHTPEMIKFLGSVSPRYIDAIFQPDSLDNENLWLMPTTKG